MTVNVLSQKPLVLSVKATMNVNQTLFAFIKRLKAAHAQVTLVYLIIQTSLLGHLMINFYAALYLRIKPGKVLVCILVVVKQQV